jgi:hypothetical protein
MLVNRGVAEITASGSRTLLRMVVEVIDKSRGSGVGYKCEPVSRRKKVTCHCIARLRCCHRWNVACLVVFY